MSKEIKMRPPWCKEACWDCGAEGYATRTEPRPAAEPYYCEVCWAFREAEEQAQRSKPDPQKPESPFRTPGEKMLWTAFFQDQVARRLSVYDDGSGEFSDVGMMNDVKGAAEDATKLTKEVRRHISSALDSDEWAQLLKDVVEGP